MALVEIETRRIREAAAKLPAPTKEKPDSAIDAGIRKSADAHATDNGTVVGTSQMLERIDELAPEVKVETKAAPVSAETKAAEAKPAPAKPAPKAD